ncbi:MAG: hypothetical protein J5935_04905 [Lachnospiraceae bacterium]|nr:hypothetical protein [Lachnospiraceae bacterium]
MTNINNKEFRYFSADEVSAETAVPAQEEAPQAAADAHPVLTGIITFLLFVLTLGVIFLKRYRKTKKKFEKARERNQNKS